MSWRRDDTGWKDRPRPRLLTIVLTIVPRWRPYLIWESIPHIVRDHPLIPPYTPALIQPSSPPRSAPPRPRVPRFDVPPSRSFPAAFLPACLPACHPPCHPHVLSKSGPKSLGEQRGSLRLSFFFLLSFIDFIVNYFLMSKSMFNDVTLHLLIKWWNVSRKQSLGEIVSLTSEETTSKRAKRYFLLFLSFFLHQNFQQRPRYNKIKRSHAGASCIMWGIFCIKAKMSATHLRGIYDICSPLMWWTPTRTTKRATLENANVIIGVKKCRCRELGGSGEG